MTVVVWDGKTLAADREAGTSYIKAYRAKKVAIIRGHLVGLAGTAAVNMEWRAWFERGADPKEFEGVLRDPDHFAHAIVITPEGVLACYQRTPYPFYPAGDRYAIGNGAEAALAALECGRDAATAVDVASRICVGVGGGVDWIALDAARPVRPNPIGQPDPNPRGGSC